MMKLYAGLAAAMVAMVLAGCATPDPGMTPITSLEGRQCPAKPEFSSAAPLTFDAKSAKATSAVVDANAPCFSDERGTSMYAAFAIPALTGQYTVHVDSVPAGAALFAPRVLLYDKDGNLKRTVMEKQITYRGSSLSAVFRYHADEQYLVVASDPAACGQTQSRIQSSIQSTMICTGYGCFEMHTGAEGGTTTTLNHNGRLLVTLEPIEQRK